jgi:uncharacterized protein (TIGR03437 family)
LRIRKLRGAALFWALPLAGQLIPVGSPIPKTAKPPVVFLNGYETSCSTTQFADTFAKFDQFLQATGRTSVFFDNCTIAGKPPIEELGNQFAKFLTALKYTDGTAVTQVDIVAHSMGGLIVRSYLAGMQTSGTFTPPANPAIRNAVFMATPHFGTDLAAVFGIDVQTQELATGSAFVFSLATWNQGTDDLRGINALSMAGNSGVAMLGNAPEGDGVSNLTSASIGFALPARTRVLPYCHISYNALVGIAGFLASLVCPPGSPGIALGNSATDPNVTMALSFLNDTPDWQNIGQSAAQNAVLSTQAGVILRAKSDLDQFVTIQDAAAGTTNLKVPPANISAYNEFVPAGNQNIVVDATGGQLKQTANLGAGYGNALTVKTGPQIARVLPAAAVVSPLNVAPGTYIAIYGSALTPATVQAGITPLPTMLGGTQVLVNGTPIPLEIVSPTQINGIFPLTASGLVTVTVTGASGSHTVNVLVAPAVPALFTQNASGSGPASALNAVTGALVTTLAPLHGGDYVALYLTGLGAKTTSGGFQVANIQPTVTVAGQPCTVQFAGAAPVYAGLDQVNCQIPLGLGANAAAAVIVTSGGRPSNTATLALQ